MSLEGPYDPENVFAKIVRREIPAARIFEDEHTLALMDAFPQARGHSLVIHKFARARNLLDVDTAHLQQVTSTVQRVAQATVAALRPDGVVVTQFNGAAAGQTVFHLHVHIIPRWDGVVLGRHGADMADRDELLSLAAQIAAQIPVPTPLDPA
jgi:histidine triad (HIT) family protein